MPGDLVPGRRLPAGGAGGDMGASSIDLSTMSPREAAARLFNHVMNDLAQGDTARSDHPRCSERICVFNAVVRRRNASVERSVWSEEANVSRVSRELAVATYSLIGPRINFVSGPIHQYTNILI